MQKTAELAYKNLEEINKDISKVYEDMKDMRANLREVVQHLRQTGMDHMVEEVTPILRAVEKSMKDYQMTFPFLIPFE